MNVQYGKAIGAGVVVGVFGGVVASGFTVASLLCCVANLAGYLGPVLSGIGAAIIGSAMQSSADIERDDEIRQGAMSGLVAGAVGALVCAVIFGLMQFISPVFSGVLYAVTADDVGELFLVIPVMVWGAIWAAFIAVVVGLFSGIGGVVGGVLCGTLIGAMKGAMRDD